VSDSMMRALLTSTLTLGLLAMGCKGSQSEEGPGSGGSSGTGGKSSGGSIGSASGGAGGAGSGGSGGSASGSGGSGTGGAGTGGDASGGSVGAGGTSAGGSGGGGDASGGGGGSAVDAASEADVPATTGDAGATGPGPGVVPLAGKAGVYICPLTSTKAQCCEMLCECVHRICADAPKAKAGQANCMPTCMGLSDTVVRCHAYHCYESVSPSGVKDHDSHCGHASNQVAGGGCPAGVTP
jgi:hypothetical protein